MALGWPSHSPVKPWISLHTLTLHCLCTRRDVTTVKSEVVLQVRRRVTWSMATDFSEEQTASNFTSGSSNTFLTIWRSYTTSYSSGQPSQIYFVRILKMSLIRWAVIIFSKRQIEFERICSRHYFSRNMTKHQDQIYVLLSLFLVLSFSYFLSAFPSFWMSLLLALSTFASPHSLFSVLSPFPYYFLCSASFYFFTLSSPIFVLISPSFHLFKLLLYL